MIREGGMVGESAYVASWRFMFLVAICRYWGTNFKDPKIAADAKKLVARIYHEEDPSLTEILFDKFKRLRKVELPNAGDAGGLGGFELDEAKAGPVLAQSITQWSRILSDFVTEHFASDPLVVTLDRLDDGWDASPEAKMLLAGVLKAARDLNIKLRKRGQPAPVITFLRTDIYDELQFNDKNKISADIEFLLWDDAALVDVAEARIARSLGIQQKGAWSSVFSSAEMRQRATTQTYVLKRTMGRPRDIVAFCGSCRTAAMKDSHNIVETSDVYAGEVDYSSHVYEELNDEMHKQVAGSRELFQTLRDIGTTRFALTDWISACTKRFKGSSEEDARVNLQTLFDFSIVGVPRRGGSGGGTQYQYKYHDRLLEPNFDADMTVHPSLKKHLRLRDASKKSSTDDAEAED